MNTKPKLAVFGILLVFGMVVSSQVYAPSLARQSSNAAGASTFPANAPAFQNPSVVPITPTFTREFIVRTLIIPRTIRPPIVDTPITQPTPLPTDPPATSIPLPSLTSTVPNITTPTSPERFQPSETLAPEQAPTETTIPQPVLLPTNTEQLTQPEPALPTDTLPPEPAAPSDTPVLEKTSTVTKSPVMKPTGTATQPVKFPTVVSPASTVAPGGDSPLFTMAQLQIAGIVAFVIVDLVLLAIILRNWNRPGRRVR